jgi:hypothetical protein
LELLISSHVKTSKQLTCSYGIKDIGQAEKVCHSPDEHFDLQDICPGTVEKNSHPLAAMYP